MSDRYIEPVFFGILLIIAFDNLRWWIGAYRHISQPLPRILLSLLLIMVTLAVATVAMFWRSVLVLGDVDRFIHWEVWLRRITGALTGICLVTLLIWRSRIFEEVKDTPTIT